MAKLLREPDRNRLRTTEPSLITLASDPSLHRIYERAPLLFPGNTLLHGALADPLTHKALTVLVDEIRYGLV